MVAIPFVKKEHSEFARGIEKKMMGLPSTTGIVFVGVDVTPTVAGQDPIYKLLIGVDRDSGLEEAVGHLATVVLSEELLTGADIQTDVRRGIARG